MKIPAGGYNRRCMDVEALTGSETAANSSVKSARRAIEILEHLGRISRPASFAEIASALGYPRSSLHGLLTTLTEMSWLELDARSRTYTLGIRAWETGRAYLRTFDLPERARPYMQRIRDEIDETVQLAVRDGRECVYVVRVDGSQHLITNYSVGGRVEAHASACGKALLSCLDPAEIRRLYAGAPLERYTSSTITSVKRLLAELAETRQRGFSVDEEEYTVGVRCLAVPVMNHDGEPIAAMSVSVPIVRFAPPRQDFALKLLTENAELLSHALGYRGDPADVSG